MTIWHCMGCFEVSRREKAWATSLKSKVWSLNNAFRCGCVCLVHWARIVFVCPCVCEKKVVGVCMVRRRQALKEHILLIACAWILTYFSSISVWGYAMYSIPACGLRALLGRWKCSQTSSLLPRRFIFGILLHAMCAYAALVLWLYGSYGDIFVLQFVRVDKQKRTSTIPNFANDSEIIPQNSKGNILKIFWIPSES